MVGYKVTENDQDVITLGNINITGNVLPPQWLKHIKMPSGKPDTIGCLILSDIVYWYRPVIVRDEVTGEVSGYNKKFKADLLQRTYDSFVDMYGFTKRQVIDAFVRLENLGLIKREFRTIKTDKGLTLSNVLYIRLYSEKVQEITKIVPPSPEISGDTPQQNEGRSTENTTETSTNNATFGCEAENENHQNQNMAASPDNGRKSKTKKPSKRKRNPIYEVSGALLGLEPSMSIGFTRKIVKELLANGHSEDHIIGCAKWLQSKKWWVDNNIKISPNQIQRHIKDYVDIGSKEFDQYGNLVTYLPDGTRMLVLKSEIQQKSNTVIVESENKPTYIDVKE